jgi:hypothetical protein
LLLPTSFREIEAEQTIPCSDWPTQRQKKGRAAPADGAQVPETAPPFPRAAWRVPRPARVPQSKVTPVDETGSHGTGDSFVFDRTRSDIMARWRQAVELGMTDEEIGTLAAIARS